LLFRICWRIRRARGKDRKLDLLARRVEVWETFRVQVEGLAQKILPPGRLESLRASHLFQELPQGREEGNREYDLEVPKC